MNDARLDDDRVGFGVVLAVGGIIPVAVAALLVTVRDHVLNANLAMILMGIVVLIAAAGGRKAGALAGLTAVRSRPTTSTSRRRPRGGMTRPIGATSCRPTPAGPWHPLASLTGL